MIRRIIVGVFVVVVFVSCAFSRQSLYGFTQDGQALFYFDIADTGESFGGGVSVWTISANHINALKSASNYWSVLLGTAPQHPWGNEPAKISVGTYFDFNDDAVSGVRQNGGGLTNLGAFIVGVSSGGYFDAEIENRAQIRFGFVSSPNTDYTGEMKLLPDNGLGSFFASIVIHEMGHALGFSSDIDAEIPTKYFFREYEEGKGLSKMNSHLYDSFGIKAVAEMEIVESETKIDGSFTLLPDGYAFFQGDNVENALNPFNVFEDLYLKPHNPNKVAGVPLLGLRDGLGNAFAHSELRNSMMSHQDYRNWSTYMEAELAIFQDIGLDIYRKNFYGFSIYYDDYSQFGKPEHAFIYSKLVDGVYVNDYNETPFGIGIHIYGSTNTFTVVGSTILTRGYSAAGIRIDGSSTVLKIDNESIIHADGNDGTGILVSYGIASKITVLGNVYANGKDGIAARFDFGDNMLGNNLEYQGSFIRGKFNSRGAWDQNLPLLFDIDGEMIDTLLIGGVLEGNRASIYISQNAFVNNIYIVNGAKIKGDIISNWDRHADFVQHTNPDKLITNLRLGFAQIDVPIEGIVYVPDLNFQFNFDDDISAQGSLNVVLYGGVFNFSGAMTGINDFSATNLTTFSAVIKDGKTVIIEAQNISLDKQANVLINYQSDFVYDDIEALKLNAQNNLNVKNQNISYSGSNNVSVGFYNNVSPSLAFKDNGNEKIVELVFDHTDETKLAFDRAAISAIGAPLFIAVKNSNANLIENRISYALSNSKKPATWVAVGVSEILGDDNFEFDINTPFISAGLDKKFGGFLMGAGFYSGFADYNSNDSDVLAQSALGFVYVGFASLDKTQIGIFAQAGNTQNTQRRKVENEKYHSDYKSIQYDLGLNISKSFALGIDKTFKPFLAYDYLVLDIDDYKETDGVYALSFDNNKTQTSTFKAGLDFDYKVRKSLSWVFNAAFIFLTGDLRASSNIAFIKSKTTTLKAEGEKLDASSLQLGADFKIQTGKRVKLIISPQAMMGQNQIMGVMTGRIVFEF
jgi:hypothetical protein